MYPPWHDEINARRYDEFANEFPMYRKTSADLVRRLDLSPDAHVLDLCCGTGTTTQAVLARLGPAGRVVAVDASAAMQGLARERIDDPRVDWVLTEAEKLAQHVTGPLDAAVCNSAIWQTDIDVVVPAVAGLLRPGGRFVSNLGVRRAVEQPTLGSLAYSIAAADHRFPSPGRRRPKGREDLLRVLTRSGFRVSEHTLELPVSAEQELAWLRIPIFTERWGVTYEQRMAALDTAWERYDRNSDLLQRWLVLDAEKP